jgi:hypothetical protein
MTQFSKMLFIVVALSVSICSGRQPSRQGRPAPLSTLVEMAEKLEPHVRDHEYYFVEISEDDGRAAQKGEQCYQVWSAKADSLFPYYAAIGISTNGRNWRVSPPVILRQRPYNQPRPKLSLREALRRAEKYVDFYGLLQGNDRLHTAYLITMPNGNQHWHVLSDHVSLVVFMEGRVQVTSEM